MIRSEVEFILSIVNAIFGAFLGAFLGFLFAQQIADSPSSIFLFPSVPLGLCFFFVPFSMLLRYWSTLDRKSKLFFFLPAFAAFLGIPFGMEHDYPGTGVPIALMLLFWATITVLFSVLYAAGVRIDKGGKKISDE